MKETPSVSIVIPAWNEKTVLPETLNALKKVDYPLVNCEVIIVAGGEDGTYSLAKNFKMDEFGRAIVLKQAPDDGQSGAIARGLKESKNDVIVLLDADTIVTREWLKELVSVLSNEGYDVACGNSFPISRNLWYLSYVHIEKIKKFKDKSLYLTGAGTIAIRRPIIEREDIEYFFNKGNITYSAFLQKQLLKKRYKIGAAEKAKVYTYTSSNFRSYLLDSIRWRRGVYLVQKKDAITSAKQLLRSGIILISAFISLLLPLVEFWLWALPFYGVFTLFILKLLVRMLPAIQKDYKNVLFFPSYLFINLLMHSIFVYIIAMDLLGKKQKMDIHYKGARPKN